MVALRTRLSQAPYPRRPLPALLEATAQRLPDKPALVGIDGAVYTYARLWAACRRLAHFLQRCAGVRPGDTVAIMAPNCPEYAIAVYGALLAGAKVTGLNPLYREREVLAQIADAEAVVAFVARPLLATGRVRPGAGCAAAAGVPHRGRGGAGRRCTTGTGAGGD